jgi:hemerythrin
MTALTLPWTENLVLLSEAMDDDHRGLLDKLNALLTAIPSRDQTRVLMAFSALTAEVRAHFTLEEARMRDVGYPDRDVHCERHQQLLQGLSELHYTLSAAQNFAGSMGPFVFLERWFVPHLTHDDKKLADFLAMRKPKLEDAGDSRAASA